MRKGCWAAVLGDCDGKMSGEHLVSESLWSGPAITVVGGPWGQVPREIGVASLTAKILCRRHNSALSIVDDAGADAFQALNEATALVGRRKILAQQDWMRVGFDVDGPLLERWFIKTAINIVHVLRGQPEWQLGAVDGAPPPELVHAAYGVAPVRRPMGLYSSARLGDSLYSDESVRAQPLWSESGRVSAMEFVFRGFTFIINLTNERIAGIKVLDPESGPERDATDLRYHLSRINSEVANRRSHFVHFEWPEWKGYHFAL